MSIISVLPQLKYIYTSQIIYFYHNILICYQHEKRKCQILVTFSISHLMLPQIRVHVRTEPERWPRTLVSFLGGRQDSVQLFGGRENTVQLSLGEEGLSEDKIR